MSTLRVKRKTSEAIDPRGGRLQQGPLAITTPFRPGDSPSFLDAIRNTWQQVSSRDLQLWRHKLDYNDSGAYCAELPVTALSPFIKTIMILRVLTLSTHLPYFPKHYASLNFFITFWVYQCRKIEMRKRCFG